MEWRRNGVQGCQCLSEEQGRVFDKVEYSQPNNVGVREVIRSTPGPVFINAGNHAYKKLCRKTAEEGNKKGGGIGGGGGRGQEGREIIKWQ